MMKNKMKHVAKSALAICLSASMFFGTSAPSFAAATGTAREGAANLDVNGDGKINYVSFGDSVTNGYGMEGYRYADGTNVYGFLRAPKDAYPAMISEYLEGYYGEGKVELEQLAISSFRMDELHAFLDEDGSYIADDYHNRVFSGWNRTVIERLLSSSDAEAKEDADALRAKYPGKSDEWFKSNYDEVIGNEYRNAVKEADLITIDLGTNNFGTFMTNKLSDVLGLNNPPLNYEMDFTQFMDEASYQSLDAMLSETVAGMVGSNEGSTYVLAKELATTLLYGYLGFTNHYDAVIDEVYRLNPNANVVVIDVYNMMAGVEMIGETFKGIDLAQLYGLFVDLANFYTREISPYAQKVTHASLSGDPGLFFDLYAEYPEKALSESAERLLEEFIMENMGYDPDYPSEREAFNKEVKSSINLLDGLVKDIQKTVENNVVKKILDGVQEAVNAVDTAIEGVATSQRLVDMIVEKVVEENGTYLAIDALKDIVIGEIEKVLADMDLTKYGFENTDADRNKLAEQIYAVAYKYNNTEDKTVANKEAVIEMMRYSLVNTKGYTEEDALSTATIAWELNAISEAQGKDAAVVAAIVNSGNGYNQEQASAMYRIYAAVNNGTTPAQEDFVIVLSTMDVPEAYAKSVYACYVTNEKNGKYQDMDVQNTIVVLMVLSGIAGSIDEATDLYANYLSYKNMPLTFSKISKNKTLYIDYLLSGNLDFDAVIGKFKAGTLVLDYPGDSASEAEKQAYYSDSSLATMYMRFLAQDGVFIHPSEEGQKELVNCVREALNNLLVKEGKDGLHVASSSKILAIGDFVNNTDINYGTLLQTEVGAAYEEFAGNGFRVNEIRALLDANYVADAYAEEVLAQMARENATSVNGLATQLKEKIKSNDVIILDIGAMNLGFVVQELIKFIESEGKETYPMSFGALENMSNKNLGATVDGLLGTIQGMVTASKAASTMLLLESYGYGLSTFTECIDNTIDAIQKLNPNASVILLGKPELFGSSTYVADNGLVFEIGEFFAHASNMMNAHMEKYAEMNKNVVYVDVTDAQMLHQTAGFTFNLAKLDSLKEVMSYAQATPEGHEYIKEQILAYEQFEDVEKGRFYYDAVYWAVDKGITNGITATTFEPETACTRAQAVTFLYRLAGKPSVAGVENPFTDLDPKAFYYDAVLWAVNAGITNGMTATTFEPQTTCTRGQIVTFIWRANDKEAAKNTTHPFTDVKEGAYYYNAMLWAVENGITKGITATTFEPDATCTRGQIVTFLYRGFAE